MEWRSQWWASSEAQSEIKKVQEIVPIDDIAITTILRVAAFDMAEGEQSLDVAFQKGFSWAMFVGNIGPTTTFLDDQIDWKNSRLKDKELQERLFDAMKCVVSHRSLLELLIKQRLEMAPFDQEEIDWEPLVNRALEAIKKDRRR